MDSIIKCIDCGEVISQLEILSDGAITSIGYRDTIARAAAFDSLRCGNCCQRLLKEGWKGDHK